MENLLKDLKEIHHPEPISWFPPAPGWYIVGIIFLLGLIYGVYLSYCYWRKWKKRRDILQQLEQLKNSPTELLLQRATILLKRVAMDTYSRQEVCSLSGQAWLTFLDQKMGTDEFSHGIGKQLLTAPYQKNPPPQAQEILDLVTRWVKKQV